ncbi:MAG TPA: LD-carboxypeptidase [Gammaproteobacteria bacterium]|nr:LD-carboxypeptidase [Gammaproteobacteria bacterium]
MLQTEPFFNQAVTNTDFQKAFQSRTIRLIAPASACNPESIEQLQTTAHLKIDVPHNMIEKNIIFHANSDENRFLQLKNAVEDKSSSTIIWTLRGGYGSARLIDYLSQCPKPKAEKIFIGSSDITALHLFLSQKWGWRTIHGAGLASILNPNQDPQNFEKIATIVSKSKKTLSLKPLIPLNAAALNTKKISGRITGGNLSIIQTSIGTSWQIQTTGKILFLEEVGEKGYRIDRVLNHLKQAGLLKKVRAIVLGQFIAPDYPKEISSAEGISEAITVAIERFAKDTQIPVFKNEQFGHGNINYPIVYNAKSEIIINQTLREFDWVMQLEN